MISTRFFMSAIALLIMVQCITCLDKTGAVNVDATKPDKNSYIFINKSESPPEEEELKESTEDNSAKKSTTTIRNIITKPVDVILWPIKGVLNSLKTAANTLYPQTTTKDKPLKNST